MHVSHDLILQVERHHVLVKVENTTIELNVRMLHIVVDRHWR